MSFLDKLEKKIGKYAIKNLMLYVIIAYAVGYFLYISGNFSAVMALNLNPAEILHGQVWRIFTFLIEPPSLTSPIFFIFVLYIYYFIGRNLERAWGAFKFNVFFFMGMTMTVVGSILIYVFTGQIFILSMYYINFSMFIAFAMEVPNVMFLFMFFIPVKAKWLAVIDFVYIAGTVVCGYLSYIVDIPYTVGYFGIGRTPAEATAAVIALVNLLVFSLLNNSRAKAKKRQKEFYKRMNSGSFGTGAGYWGNPNKGPSGAGPNPNRATNATRGFGNNKPIHVCAVCGKTDIDDENETFRYCSICKGNYEYCSEHIKNHTHMTE